VSVPINQFIKAITEKDYAKAVAAIKTTNLLPAVCGRVCPQEEQCEKVCVLTKKQESVAIGRLERFVADWEAQQGESPLPAMPPKTGKKVAVVGSGPADHLRRVPDPEGPRRNDVRGAAQGRRRARLRHPGVPAPEGDRAARGGVPPAHGRGAQVRLRRRQDAHDRRADGAGRL